MPSSPREVIIRPVVSEKSYSLIDDGTYTFVVHADARKTEIRDAVERIWDVKVSSVNTMNRKGKNKQTRFGIGTRPRSKRAIVRLVSGEKIELFETK